GETQTYFSRQFAFGVWKAFCYINQKHKNTVTMMKTSPTLPLWIGVALAAVILGHPNGARAAVTVAEQDITIPTYLAGDPEPNPMFYFGRDSQGAAGRVYPYPLYDSLTHVKSNKT